MMKKIRAITSRLHFIDARVKALFSSLVFRGCVGDKSLMVRNVKTRPDFDLVQQKRTAMRQSSSVDRADSVPSKGRLKI